MVPHVILYVVLLAVYIIYPFNKFYSLYICLKLFSFDRCYKSNWKTKCIRFLTKCVRFLTKRMHQLLRMVFGKAFKPGRNDSEEDPKTVFYDYEVTNLVVYAFALIILEMFLVLTIIFWNKFLFKISYGCPYNIYVSNLICYNSSSDDRDPINCSNSEELLNDRSIECYRLIFDWSSAAGATGGIYVLLSFGITYIPCIMLKIKTKMNRTWTKIVHYLTPYLFMAIEYGVFVVYVFVFLKDEKHALGVLLSAIGVFLIFLTISVIPLAEFKKIDELDTQDSNVNVNGANESTYLFTQQQT